MRRVGVVLVSIVLAGPVHAAAGALEINQTCAIQSGCFANDAPGFPVTISTSGSYRLTSNLVVPDENTSAIAVGDAFVRDFAIDLAGFEISGPVVCSFHPNECSHPPSAGSGVEALAFSNSAITVRNGTIRGMGGHGVRLGDAAEVAGLTVSSNGANGIQVETGARVSNSTASRNGMTGITAGNGSLVIETTVFRNRREGVLVATGASVTGNVVYQNGLTGIRTLSGSSVQGNTVQGNGDVGVTVGLQSSYRDNMISGNATTQVNGGGLNAGGNVCGGPGTASPSCP